MKGEIEMRKIKIAGLVLALVTAVMIGQVLPINVQANTLDASGSITAIGKASVMAEPDVAYVTLGVVTEALDAETAQKEAALKMEEIINVIKASGIEEKNIKTTNYSVYPRYDWSESRSENRIVGYQVNHMVDIKIEEIKSSGALLDSVIKAGGNQVQGIRFGLNDETAFYAQALELAVKDAEVKAKAMGRGLGIINIKPVSITEQGSYNVPYRAMDQSQMMMESAEYKTEIMSGEMQINAEVIVEFKY